MTVVPTNITKTKQLLRAASSSSFVIAYSDDYDDCDYGDYNGDYNGDYDDDDYDYSDIYFHGPAFL